MMIKKVNFWIGLSPLIISFATTLAMVFLLKFLPSKLPLFYSLTWGEKQLATKEELFIIPASITFITVLNFIFSTQLHAAQSFFKKMLFITSVISSLILTIAFIKILLNFI